MLLSPKKIKISFSISSNALKLDLSKASEFLHDAKELHVAHPFLDKSILNIQWFEARALTKLTIFIEVDKIFFKVVYRVFDASACRCKKQ